MTEKLRKAPKGASTKKSKHQMRAKRKTENIKHEERRLRTERTHNWTKNILFGLFVLVCVLFLLKIKGHKVDGESMMPTLENGDQIFVVKGKVPIRYDLVTFAPIDKPKESYIKRVIGLPGDRIWVEGNALFINQQSDEKLDPIEDELAAKKLPDGTIKVNILTQEAFNEFYDLSQIPLDRYFVLGDNRNHSTDSRALGFVSKNQLEGVAELRYFPFSRMGILK